MLTIIIILKNNCFQPMIHIKLLDYKKLLDLTEEDTLIIQSTGQIYLQHQLMEAIFLIKVRL